MKNHMKNHPQNNWALEKNGLWTRSRRAEIRNQILNAAGQPLGDPTTGQRLGDPATGQPHASDGSGKSPCVTATPACTTICPAFTANIFISLVGITSCPPPGLTICDDGRQLLNGSWCMTVDQDSEQPGESICGWHFLFSPGGGVGLLIYYVPSYSSYSMTITNSCSYEGGERSAAFFYWSISDAGVAGPALAAIQTLCTAGTLTVPNQLTDPTKCNTGVFANSQQGYGGTATITLGAC